MNIKNVVIICLFTILLTSCIKISSIQDCPDGVIEWVDIVMVQDIQYQHHFPEPADEHTPTTIEKGKKLGEVTYTMADSACSNHKMKNGDAAYLEEGTAIYEIKGYPSTLAIMANDKAYIVETNKKAKTAGELYPLGKLVKNIYIESTEDGSRIHTFSQTSKDNFLNAWLNLKLEDIETLHKNGHYEGSHVFIEIELNNGVTFREVYWAESNTFNSGIVGNKDIKDILEYELSNIRR
ncbi:hypothetical protein KM915_22960 [Cytobacillus oceanisediminis]|uniref:hypothetical protein n=1 Tax=Cytobacillus oceanisediminis TaxID=665099 RepID=UPI001C2193DB|nr:hypothetical protein [Cytobacillus oceanisediminis]MBU8732876.1 hypothetical protein [Cytobacillus oceanisediminis]